MAKKEVKKSELELTEEEKKKKKSPSNYVLLAIIFLVSMGLTIYLCKWYQVYEEAKKQTPVIRGTLTYEIVSKDLEPFIIENPNTVMYMCTSNSLDCRNFEKEFKKIINQHKLHETIIYLNLTDTNINNFVEEFNKKYTKKVKLTSYIPAIVIFEDGKVTHILQGEDNNKMSTNKTKSFINTNKIGE